MLVKLASSVGVDVPDELCSGLAPILNDDGQLELQQGSTTNKFTLSCGDDTIVRIGVNTKHLVQLQFLKGIKTSQYGRPHFDETTQNDEETGYQLGASLYNKHGHPVKKMLTDEEQRELLDSYKMYYDTAWDGFPSRASQGIAMHRTIHLAEDMFKK